MATDGDLRLTLATWDHDRVMALHDGRCGCRAAGSTA